MATPTDDRANGEAPTDAGPGSEGAAAATPSGPAPAGQPGEPAATDDTPATAQNVDDVLARLRAAGVSARIVGGDTPAPTDGSDGGGQGTAADDGSPDDGADALAQAAEVLDGAARTAQTEQLLAERTDDLQRLQAEYANYRKRVERDRATARQQGVESVIRELVPILDAIAQAEQHEELTGGFKVVAGEFTRLADKLGLQAFGAVGDNFDPTLHEALMQMPAPGVEPGHVAQIIQPGYRLNDTVLRPARVAVASDE
jgi:molecular chaperone GrpE